MADDLVQSILASEKEKEEKAIRSTQVDKEVPLNFDLGHLSVYDPNLIDEKKYRKDVNSYLAQVTRDNAQLFINELWNQETMKVDGYVVAKLPKPILRLPRAKAIPKPKAPTKWEAFAAKKGIQNRKKDKLVYDEASGEWRPRFGYKSAKNQSADDWMVEDKPGADPEELLNASRVAKKERVAKNEYQRLRNIARSTGIKVANNVDSVAPAEAIRPGEKPVVNQLEKAASLAKVSTASIGKFQEQASNEKPVKGVGGKKRKFEPNETNIDGEKNKNLKLAEEILTAQPKLNIKKAVTNQELTTQNAQAQANREAGGRNKKAPKGKKGRNGRPGHFDKHKNKFTGKGRGGSHGGGGGGRSGGRKGPSKGPFKGAASKGRRGAGGKATGKGKSK